MHIRHQAFLITLLHQVFKTLSIVFAETLSILSMMFPKTTYVVTFLSLHATLIAAAKSVSNTLLVFARDSSSAGNAISGLQGYGIPYQTVVVPASGISSLPTLNSSATTGNYGGIVILSEVAYDTANGFVSALTRNQLDALYAYQENFGVRMVRLDVFPSTDLGKTVSAVTIASLPWHEKNAQISQE